MANVAIKPRFTHIVTHLHPTGSEALKILRATFHRLVADQVRARAPLDARALSALRAFPEIAFVLAAGLLQSEAAMNQVRGESSALLQILFAEYDLAAADHENFLLGEGQGEVVFRLLAWAKSKGRTLAQPMAIYEEWLARDPFWAAQWLRVNPSATFAARIAHFADECRHDDAGAAFAWLATHPKEDSNGFERVILQDSFYTFAALAILPGRVNPALVLGESLTPRWAYHLAVSGACPDRSLLEDVLIKDMGWLVEYFVDSGLHESDGKRVAELYVKSVRMAMETATHHCCIEAFHTWVNRLTAFHKTKKPAAAA